MKTKVILLLIIISFMACSHIDKKSRSLLLHERNNFKVGLTEKNNGVMLKLVYKF